MCAYVSYATGLACFTRVKVHAVSRVSFLTFYSCAFMKIGRSIVSAHSSKCGYYLHADQLSDAQIRHGCVGHGYQRIPSCHHGFQRQKYTSACLIVYRCSCVIGYLSTSRAGLPGFPLRPKGFLHLDGSAVRWREPLWRQYGRNNDISLCW